MLNDGLIIVKARISMKRTEEGGRPTGFKAGYRPNHVFEMPKDLKNLIAYGGDIQFEDQELIDPGETKIVTVRFLKHPSIEIYMKIDQQWFINEGARTLGFGEIVEVLKH